MGTYAVAGAVLETDPEYRGWWSPGEAGETFEIDAELEGLEFGQAEQEAINTLTGLGWQEAGYQAEVAATDETAESGYITELVIRKPFKLGFDKPETLEQDLLKTLIGHETVPEEDTLFIYAVLGNNEYETADAEDQGKSDIRPKITLYLADDVDGEYLSSPRDLECAGYSELSVELKNIALYLSEDGAEQEALRALDAALGNHFVDKVRTHVEQLPEDVEAA